SAAPSPQTKLANATTASVLPTTRARALVRRLLSPPLTMLALFLGTPSFGETGGSARSAATPRLPRMPLPRPPLNGAAASGVGGVGRAWAGDLLTPPTPPSGTTPVQSATQTNSGTNTADQNAVSAPTVVNASPNVAIANGGSDSVTKSSATNTPSCNPCAGQGGGNVTQNSGSVVNAPASNKA